MNADEIKRDFIKYMEEKHAGLLYPKNYFGCMMAVVVEQEPVTQDRIGELTGYSKTTVSQMLKLLQVNFPLKQVKKPGMRKKHYTFGLTTREFMITFLKMIIDLYKDRVDFLLPLIEESKPFTQKHPRFSKFHDFLERYHEMSTLYVRLFTDTSDEFSNMIKTGQINASGVFKLDMVNFQENLTHIQDLLKPPELPSSFSSQRIVDEQLQETYSRLKNKFYEGFRENLISAGSRTSMARAIIGTELLLEQRPMTQEEIEKSTDFQRSIISDTLKLLLRMKMIQLIKKPGNRKKYYMMIQSWDSRTISRLRMNVKSAIESKEKMTSLIERVGEENAGEESNTLLTFLQDIRHSYEQSEQYFKLLEMRFLNIRLKEHLELKKSSQE